MLLHYKSILCKQYNVKRKVFIYFAKERKKLHLDYRTAHLQQQKRTFSTKKEAIEIGRYVTPRQLLSLSLSLI